MPLLCHLKPEEQSLPDAEFFVVPLDGSVLHSSSLAVDLEELLPDPGVQGKVITPSQEP
jgi:hypothetical protein